MNLQLITEKDFLRTLTELAALTGWQFYHPLPATNRRGQWATFLMGNAGFPDLTLVRGDTLVFAELKVGYNKPNAAQIQWLEKLQAVKQVQVYLWHPKDWDEIVKILK